MDAQYPDVRETLKLRGYQNGVKYSYGKPGWSHRPRPFIILHMIGCPDALDGFVAENLSDLF